MERYDPEIVYPQGREPKYIGDDVLKRQYNEASPKDGPAILEKWIKISLNSLSNNVKTFKDLLVVESTSPVEISKEIRKKRIDFINECTSLNDLRILYDFPGFPNNTEKIENDEIVKKAYYEKWNKICLQDIDKAMEEKTYIEKVKKIKAAYYDAIDVQKMKLLKYPEEKEPENIKKNAIEKLGEIKGELVERLDFLNKMAVGGLNTKDRLELLIDEKLIEELSKELK